MKLPKVGLDFATIHDPYKLLFVLSGLDKTHSEILLPDVLATFELSYPGGELPTINILKDNCIHEDSFKKFVGLEGVRINNNNFLAGWQILRMAYEKGMITIYDAFEFSQIGYKILDPKFRLLEVYSTRPPGFTHDLSFIPDWGYRGNVSLIAQHEINGVIPVIGDLAFLEYLKLYGSDICLFGNCGKPQIDEGVQLLLESPEATNIDELFFLATNLDFIKNVTDKIEASKLKKNTKKDLAILGIEFSTTIAIDTLAFSGIPVSSGALLVYKIAERLIRVKAKKGKPDNG